jgi:hypothetical protein
MIESVYFEILGKKWVTDKRRSSAAAIGNEDLTLQQRAG